MPKPSDERRRRSLVSLGDLADQLLDEADARGLPLATYLRMLIATHPDRRQPRVKRAG